MAFVYIGAGILSASAFFFVDLYLNKITKGSKRVSMVLSSILFALFFFRYLLGDDAIELTIGLNVYSPFGYDGQVFVILSLLVLWAGYSAVTLLVMSPYFNESVKCVNGLVKYYATPVFLIRLCTLPLTAVALEGRGVLSSFSARELVHAFEIGAGLSMCFSVWKKNPKTHFSKREFLPGLCAAVAMFLVSMPACVPRAFFGNLPESVKIKDFSLIHRLFVYAAILFPVAFYFLLRKKEFEQKRFALLYLSLSALTSYCYRYTLSTFAHVTAWPLHLCNTAMFIVPLCLMFKWDKLYYFTLFINVLGAFFAMLMPNYSDTVNAISPDCVNFWINHFCAFFMPVLLIALRIYPRPKMRQFVYSLLAFAVYFLLILFINAWFTNYGSVDFFFLNSDYIAEKLGKWAENLRNAVWSFRVNGLNFTFYPVYQTVFFFVYVLLALAMWFLYEQFFQVGDLYLEMGERNKKIKADRLALEVRMAGRSMDQPVNPAGADKLVLRNFSKKYATSDVYAVRDANLEIEGGTIFGFLGPNGAGKSTIIKSIVGIQTITSGEIEVCGYDVEKQPVGAKLQTGFVPDHYALYENLTGREYVNYIADLYHVSEEDRTKRINEYVERFYLTNAFDNQIRTYSHGMKQKITIMSALVHNPKLWILDEPLTGLDPESIFQVKECMKKHAEEGNIVFFSSHIIDVVERICDRIAIIKKGTVLCEKSVKEIEASGEPLEDFYMRMIGETKHD